MKNYRSLVNVVTVPDCSPAWPLRDPVDQSVGRGGRLNVDNYLRGLQLRISNSPLSGLQAASRSISGRLSLLANAVDAPQPLLQARRIPRQVVVDHQSAELEVDAFACRFCRYSRTKASSGGEIDAAFAQLARERSDALFVGSGVFFLSRRVQLVHLVTRHALVAIYSSRDYAVAGGLLTYGTAVTDAYRQVGVYAGRILKGVKPAELPVMQSAKFELVINRQTAKTLGIDVPPTPLARADEVIE
jgi:hypothetical protein